MTNYLFDLIRSRSKSGEAVFLQTPGGGKLTYAEMIAKSGRVANVLIGLNVQPGDRVAVQVEKSPEALLLYLACIRCGAVFLPLNTAYTAAEVSYFLSDSTPSLFVCDPGQGSEKGTIARTLGVPSVETLGTHGDGTIADKMATAAPDGGDRARRAEDLAAILYTSGTTGRSKGAMLSHENLASNALALVDAWRFTAGDHLIHALPIYHTHGLFVAINTVLFSGARMTFLPRFDPAEIVRLLPYATALMGVPTYYTRLLQRHDLDHAATRGMRLFVSGSAPLLSDTHRAWRERTGHVILERYGMTETNMNTSNPYDGERRAGTVGFPLPGVELRITEPESGKPLPTGAIGMIEVKGPNVFKGYWNLPEKTASEFRSDGFFITGDLGLIDEQNYVQIVGRGKDLVITGGFNVYPKEVESEIDAIEGVIESAVIGLPHSDFGEGVTAVIVKQSDVSLDEKTITSALESRLARFKHPKAIFFVEDLPRNAMGKIQKNVLRETYKDTFQKAP